MNACHKVLRPHVHNILNRINIKYKSRLFDTSVAPFDRNPNPVFIPRAKRECARIRTILITEAGLYFVCESLNISLTGMLLVVEKFPDSILDERVMINIQTEDVIVTGHAQVMRVAENHVGIKFCR